MDTLPITRKMTKRQKPTWPQLTWGQVLFIEVIFGLSLLAVLNREALIEYESVIKKAQLSSVFYALSSDRLALQEQLALTGEGFPSSQSGASTVSATGEGKRVGKKYHDKGLEYSVTRVENSLVVNGNLETGRPFYLSYTPAVIASGVPGSMMWLCGNRKPPTGWTRLPGPTGTDLPAKYLFSVCRDNQQ